MRILHTVPDPGWAGREERVLETALWQKANGHQVWIGAPPDNDLHIYAPENLTLKYSPASEGITGLRQMIEQLRIDVLDCHGLRDTSAAVLAGLSVPVVHSRHCLLRDSDMTSSQRFIWRKLDRVIAVAKAIKSELIDNAIFAPERIDVIGEWAPPSFFQAADAKLIGQTRSQIGVSPQHPVIAFVGMVREDKGIEIFLRAAALARASIPDLKVLVVGASTSAKGTDSPELRALRSIGRSLGLSGGLVTTGFRDDINVILGCVDLLIVPSLREAQSRVIPQAFASKTPVIASAVGGISELVADGVTGWLVSPNNHVELADRIVSSMNDPKARSDVANNAHIFAQGRLRPDNQMRDTLAAYERALEISRRSGRTNCVDQSAARIKADRMNPLSQLHVMIVVAHQDDETLGAAAAMSDFRRVTLVHTTDGAPSRKMARKRGHPTRVAYSKARLQEMHRALSHARIEIDFVSLGVRDQRAALEMPRLTRSLRELLGAYKPDAILTHAFEGGHPDHDATAFAVHAAQKGFPSRIPIFEVSGYHNAFGVEAYGIFIPRDEVQEITIRLTPHAIARKAAMLQEFVSQQKTTACFPMDYERFRPAPEYDFGMRPHEGKLFYERYPFGMTWRRWKRLVKKAVCALERPSNSPRFWMGIFRDLANIRSVD